MFSTLSFSSLKGFEVGVLQVSPLLDLMGSKSLAATQLDARWLDLQGGSDTLRFCAVRFMHHRTPNIHTKLESLEVKWN